MHSTWDRCSSYNGTPSRTNGHPMHGASTWNIPRETEEDIKTWDTNLTWDKDTSDMGGAVAWEDIIHAVATGGSDLV